MSGARSLAVAACNEDADLSLPRMCSGIVISAVYLCTMGLEYRRREKRMWLWRLVRRPNGRFLVGKYVCTVPY